MESNKATTEVEPCPEENSAIYKHQGTVDVTQAQDEIELAKNEWDQVEHNIPGLLSRSRTTVTYDDVVQYLEAQDMSQYMKNIKPTIKRKGLMALVHRLIGPPALKKDFVPERNFIFAIAQYPCDIGQSLHSDVLQTIYRELTGMCSNSTTGSHWEDIGFQGNNPTNDLRGAGFLGLLQLLYFILSPKTADLAKEIFLLSQHPTQHFPFCVMSINVTRITLEALREKILNRECNKREKVFPVANEFYAGIFSRLYSIWKLQNKTIIDAGYVLKDVSKHAKAKTKSIFEAFNTQCTERKKEDKTDLVQFTDIGDIAQST